MNSEMEEIINEENVCDLDKNVYRVIDIEKDPKLHGNNYKITCHFPNPSTQNNQVASSFENPAKRECPYNLNVSIEDVIGFFNDNEYWKGHCQKIQLEI